MNRVITMLALLTGLSLTACNDTDSYSERMAEQHAGETPEASPMVSGTDADVQVQEVNYFNSDGASTMGYLARPAGADGTEPGIIVIHEWWGLNDNIRSMADELAGLGYAALAVDLYGGQMATDAEGAMGLMQAAMQQPDLATANLKAAYAYLTETLGAAKVGSIGWCFGGGMSLRTALALPTELDAAVIYYGQVTDDKAALATLEVPVLGLFGAEDGGIPVAGVQAFQNALQELGKEATVKIYDGAAHAFANPSGQAYQEEAAEDAWAMTTSFFAEHLKN